MENCKACGIPLEDWEELSTHCEGCEQMAQQKQLPGDLWTIGTALADAVGIAHDCIRILTQAAWDAAVVTA